MRSLCVATLVLSCFWTVSLAADVPKPAKVPTALTEAQREKLQEGVALHDGGRFMAAAAVYEAILTENPDAVQVLAESCLSWLAAGDCEKALTFSLRGAEYKSPWLGQFYSLAGECYEKTQRAEQAVPFFQAAIGAQPDNFLAYYRLGVTFAGLKRLQEAREALKAAVALAPDRSDPHYALGMVMRAEGLRVPALLALLRFLVLEPETDRSKEALRIVSETLDALGGKAETGERAAGADSEAEGDYTAVAGAVTQAWNRESDDPVADGWSRLTSTVGALFDRLGKEDPAWRETFSGKFYVPYFAALSAKGWVPPFCAHIFRATGNDLVGAYIRNEGPKVDAFLEWSALYRWPRPADPKAGPAKGSPPPRANRPPSAPQGQPAAKKAPAAKR